MKTNPLLLVMLTAAPLWAQGSTATLESLLPPKTMAIGHFKVQEVWQSDAMKFSRDFLGYAGADAVKEFQRRFGNYFANMESLTVILPNSEATPELPHGYPERQTALWVVTTKTPYDRIDLIKALPASAYTKKHRRYDYLFDERSWSGLYLHDDRTLVYGSEESLTHWFDLRTDAKEGPLAQLLRADAGKSAVLIGIDPSSLLSPENVRAIPEPFLPLFKAKTWSASLTLNKETRVTARIEFPTPDQAKDGEQTVKTMFALAKTFLAGERQRMEQDMKKAPVRLPFSADDFGEGVAHLFGVAAANFAHEFLTQLPLEIKGSTLQASIDADALIPNGVPAAQMAMALGFASINLFSRSYASSSNDQYNVQNFYRVGKALEKYHQDKGSFPPRAITDPNGKPLLSWRVALLPYLGQESLYKQFKLDESWDSPHNRKLLGRMPYEMQSQTYDRYRGRQYSMRSAIQLVTGPKTLYEGTQGMGKFTINQPHDRAVLLIQVHNSDSTVLWTKPEDVAYHPAKKLPALVNDRDNQGILIFTVDGMVRRLPKEVTEQGYRSLFELRENKILVLPAGVLWDDLRRNENGMTFSPTEKK